MAVVIQCFHCDTILELDEGFRGGVCRCSTCGSLLQVPKASSPGAAKARPAAPGAQPIENKRPANPNADAGLSRGQFDPKNQNGGGGVRPAVPDFGGSSSGLRQGRPAAPVATAAPGIPRRIEKVEPISGPTRPGLHVKRVKKNNAMLYTAIALSVLIVLVVLVIVAISILFPGELVNGKRITGRENGGSAPTQQSKGVTADGKMVSDGSVTKDGASDQLLKGFLGVPLVGKKIVISVDGGSSMRDTFNFVQVAIYHAVAGLDAGQEVQVVIWKDRELKRVPSSGFVGKSGLAQLQAQLDLVPAMGSSDPEACMKATAGLGADQVVFVTAKDGLEPGITDEVLEGNASSVRFDGIKIEGDAVQSPLELLATKTGGTYRVLSTAALEKLAH